MKKFIFWVAVVLVWMFTAVSTLIAISTKEEFDLVDTGFCVLMFVGCLFFTLIAFYDFSIYLEKHEKSKTKG